MPIINVNTNFAGQSGVIPTFIFIETNDTYDQVKSLGYLNDLVKDNLSINEGIIAVVSTKPSRNSRTSKSYIFDISKSGNNFSLVNNTGIIAGTTTIYGGGGTGTVFTVAGLTSNSKGAAIIRTSTNNVSITRAIPGVNTLSVTFSADPGANTTVDFNYAINSSP